MFGFEGPTSQPAPTPLDVRALANRVKELEMALVHCLNLLQIHITQTQQNEMHIHNDVVNLTKYVMKPRTAINGEGKELN